MSDRKEIFALFGVPTLLLVLCFVLLGLTIYEDNKELSEPIEGTVFGKEFIPEDCSTIYVNTNSLLVPVQSCSSEEYYLKIREDGSNVDVPIRVTRNDFSKYDFGDRYSRNTND